MSHARTALRLQAVLALLADPVIDALCQGRVYDSRISDFDQAEPVPTIVLSVGNASGRAWSKNNGGPPFDDACDLVLEIGMTIKRPFTDPILGEVEGLGPPETDAQMEDDLDTIEARAVEVLGVGDTPEARLLREVTRRITHRDSVPFQTDQGLRYATRLVTFKVELKGEDADPDDPDLGVPPDPDDLYTVLPEPLRTIARAMPPGFSGRTRCDRIARTLALLPPEPGTNAALFGGADLVIAPQTLSADTRPSQAVDLGAGRIITAAADFPDP